MKPSSSVGSTVAVAVGPVVALVQCLSQSIAAVELESVWELVAPPPAESQLAEVTYQPAELTCHQPAVASAAELLFLLCTGMLGLAESMHMQVTETCGNMVPSSPALLWMFEEPHLAHPLTW